MKLIIHKINNTMIAELTAESAIIKNVEDAVDLLGNASYQEAIGIVVQERHLYPEFFDLSTRMAGEILQKFSNYRMKLAIVGDFSKYASKSLKDFMLESNKTGHIIFVASNEEALKKMTDRGK